MKEIDWANLSFGYMVAFVSDVRMIANYWLRPGNTSASTNYLSFLLTSREA